MTPHVLLSAAAVVMGLAIPAAAEAQVRATGLVGVDSLNRAPTALSLRAELSVSLIPWLHLGGYATALTTLDKSTTGYSAGGLLALRPAIPGTSIDPMAFASVGYLRTPGDATERGTVLQIGGGLVLHMTPMVDLELRAALLQMLVTNDDLTGFTGAVGLSLHP